jgi:hypothetical protein
MSISFRSNASLAIALVALIAALGGSAYAASKITSRDVDNRSLRGIDLADDTVRGKQIREASLDRVPSAADADALGGESADDQKVRWFLLNEAGQIEDQSGGFEVIDAYQTNANAYIDAGESLVGKGFTATIAIQNLVDVDGMNGDAEPNFSGEVSATRCQIANVVACAPPGAQKVNALVVSPRNSDGSATTAGARKRVYVTVTE